MEQKSLWENDLRINEDFKQSAKPNGAVLGFEKQLWEAAEKLRGHMDAAEYKNVVLGLIFLKYISDQFQYKYDKLTEENALERIDPEDRHYYKDANIFWVPKEARWNYLCLYLQDKNIGQHLDYAMEAIELLNPQLKDVLPKDYSKLSLHPQQLSGVVKLISRIGFTEQKRESKDILGRAYEYFLSQFASAEGKKGGQFYTPQCVVSLLVEMLAPSYKGTVYDPCCGSGGMFVQSERFVEHHGGRAGDIIIYGQESNPKTWKLARMNLALRGLKGNLGSHWADTFHNDLHSDLEADYIIANPPFNMKEWGGERLRSDKRWLFGIPPIGNANFAWVQHFIHHLSKSGTAGFVLANGSMSSNTSNEGEIRKTLIENDLVECIVSLPGHLFYSTQISVCLWFVTRNKKNGTGFDGKLLRNRSGETLFIDVRTFGTMVDRVHRELTDEEIRKIANTYHAWRGDNNKASYKNIPGFCKSATIASIRSHKYALVPGRYVGFDKTAQSKWHISELINEVNEIEHKLKSISTSSKRAIAIVKELLNG